MYKAIVFAGTTEGYALCRFLSENGTGVYACVATEYGSRSVEENSCLKIRAARLSEEEMEALFEEIRPEIVLDATHPYAAEVTENIRNACANTNMAYRRVLRDEGGRQDHAVYVDSPEEAVQYLEGTTGNILLTTGSKELGKFTALTGFKERVFARVLSLPSVMTACASYGLEGKHLIGMQGPFSVEMNVATMRQYDCRYLVTKDSGKAGGFPEKADAAFACGAELVIIGRPLKEEGISLEECKQMLAERFGIPYGEKPVPEAHELRDIRVESAGRSHVTLLGIGMGSRETLTIEGQKALERANLLIGARRMVDSVKLPHHQTFYEYRSEVIADYIASHPEFKNVVIALSGDVGFYSGAKKLLDLLGEETDVICGISSVAYFMAKARLSWDDAKIVSAHGRNCNLVSLIRHHRKVFAILGTTDGVAKLAKKLTDYGMGEVILHVGENLSYENEKIFAAPARELAEYEGDALSVVCAYHEQAVPVPATHGIADCEFIRGKAPMTKEEVRTVSLAKLKLQEDSVCYDVGAGTGSVSIEMALRAHQGMVYAVEKKEEAAALLFENKRKFAVDNLEIIRGTAPEALEALPVPTHAFIGGSSGNLKEILDVLLKKNLHVRIVINCITLETISEALGAIREFAFDETDVVQLSAARAKVLGRYHMMMGENPIYIITCQKTKKED
ncbi:MAG: precorrin-6A reductase [Eubacteriales bacterium]|nr:precorrin-6A reductase [Eubacteriales bacterium]